MPKKIGRGNKVVQRRSNIFNTVSSTTASIPRDGTIPQDTEGTLLATVTITPTDVNSIMVVEGFIHFAGISAAVTLTISRSGAGNVINVHEDLQTTTTVMSKLSVQGEDEPGVTSQVTYRLRIGTSAGTLQINRLNGATDFYGAGDFSGIIVTEYKPSTPS